MIAGISDAPAKADALKPWGRGFGDAVHPDNPGCGYVNFMMDDEADGRLQATFGSNDARLAR